MDKNKLLLIDGSSVAFRAFFALYHQIDRFKSPTGLHTNAIYGFHLMLDHMMKRIEPTHILVAFDAGKTTFRTEMFADYKAGRAKTPDEFREQFPFIRQMLDAMGIKHYELSQYEADDIIGTLDKMAERTDIPFDVTIVSGDKDLIQLTDENTVVEISKKGVTEFEEFTPSYLMEKMGITPTQFIDLKALMGDKSDNIPGVTKIGEKTGLKLLTEFGSLEGIYEHIDSMKASKMKENLIADKEQAFLSRTLATIDTQAPIEIGLDDIVYQGPRIEELGQFYDDMGFKQLRVQLGTTNTQEEEVLDYQIVSEVSSAMFKKDQFFYFEILGENYHREEVVGLAWGDKDGIYVGGPELLDSPVLKDFLEHQPIKTYDFKRGKVLLARKGIDLLPATFDSRLAKYLLSTVDDNALTTIAHLYGQTSLIPDEAIYGKGAKLALPERDVFFPHLARKVQVLLETEAPMLAKLEENQQSDLLFEMELPLANVLAKMEIAGIKVKVETLKAMQAENEVLIEQLTKEIYELAGQEFNINSPKQLGTILFEDMGLLPLEYTKKTKTGYSTAVDVLERLAPIAPVVSKILDYRQITKLQSTYVIGLQDAILEDGKIHTRYVQDLTQTGRLSSTDPNLQNIPVRLEQGRLIRKAFVPSLENSVLLASDYSQIELRVLAHISQDQHLIEAFQQGADIHTSTAMRVFGIEKAEDVTPNDRRNAKAVNFGVVYGISDFGLSNNLGISRKEAKNYIDTYFERFPGIKNYMETIVREARDKGYVETLYKRRRELPDINSRNFNVRNFAERTAINSPIQGSAADILKVAMINLDKALTDAGLSTRMLLQVHDEIVLEVPMAELETVKAMVKETMESAIQLSVPLIADENEGETWYEAK
ncbi:TPA: DNA polymerase I [Streptococcus suis]